MGSLLEDREKDDLVDRLYARIAALEAQVAKLRAPVERSEAIRAWNAWMMVAHPEEGMTSVLNAFLEGRKG